LSQRRINFQNPNAPKTDARIDVSGQFVTEGGEVFSVNVHSDGSAGSLPLAGLTVGTGGLTVTGNQSGNGTPGVFIHGSDDTYLTIPNGETLKAVFGVEIATKGVLRTQSTLSKDIQQVSYKLMDWGRRCYWE
jgi:hypothetical protein